MAATHRHNFGNTKPEVIFIEERFPTDSFPIRNYRSSAMKGWLRYSYNDRANVHSYFEGWYFKHQKEDLTFALIPGINIDGEKKKSAFIQVITNNSSYNVLYKFSEFQVSQDGSSMKIGENIFACDGLHINIRHEGLSIRGSIGYSRPLPLKYDIMGPFRWIPFMQCRHAVLSLGHKLKGEIVLNGGSISMEEGTGYIEKDWGHSFPKYYLWTQCNTFEDRPTSIMAAAADIPMAGFRFRGCICVVYDEGIEHRLATYLGVRVIEYASNRLVLKQKGYRLEIDLLTDSPQRLFAPQRGEMTRTVHEHSACTVRYRFYRDGELKFDLTSPSASFEFVE